jgi:hypothetical protein
VKKISVLVLPLLRSKGATQPAQTDGEERKKICPFLCDKSWIEGVKGKAKSQAHTHRRRWCLFVVKAQTFT